MVYLTWCLANSSGGVFGSDAGFGNKTTEPPRIPARFTLLTITQHR